MFRISEHAHKIVGITWVRPHFLLVSLTPYLQKPCFAQNEVKLEWRDGTSLQTSPVASVEQGILPYFPKSRKFCQSNAHSRFTNIFGLPFWRSPLKSTARSTIFPLQQSNIPPYFQFCYVVKWHLPRVQIIARPARLLPVKYTACGWAFIVWKGSNQPSARWYTMNGCTNNCACCSSWMDLPFLLHTVSLTEVRRPPMLRVSLNCRWLLPEASATSIPLATQPHHFPRSFLRFVATWRCRRRRNLIMTLRFEGCCSCSVGFNDLCGSIPLLEVGTWAADEICS